MSYRPNEDYYAHALPSHRMKHKVPKGAMNNNSPKFIAKGKWNSLLSSYISVVGLMLHNLGYPVVVVMMLIVR